jgi:hypothetical protein
MMSTSMRKLLTVWIVLATGKAMRPVSLQLLAGGASNCISSNCPEDSLSCAV